MLNAFQLNWQFSVLLNNLRERSQLFDMLSFHGNHFIKGINFSKWNVVRVCEANFQLSSKSSDCFELFTINCSWSVLIRFLWLQHTSPSSLKSSLSSIFPEKSKFSLMNFGTKLKAEFTSSGVLWRVKSFHIKLNAKAASKNISTYVF